MDNVRVHLFQNLGKENIYASKITKEQEWCFQVLTRYLILHGSAYTHASGSECAGERIWPKKNKYPSSLRKTIINYIYVDITIIINNILMFF